MRRVIVLLATTALIASACGGSSSDQTTGNQDRVLLTALLHLERGPSTITLTVRSDPQSLQALATQDGGARLPGTDIHKILSSSVTVSHDDASNPRDARSEMSVNVGGDSNAIETRTVDRTLYVRADARGLAKMFGKSDAELQSLIRKAESSGLSFVGPAVRGKWLSISGMDKMGGQFGSAPATNSKGVGAFAQKVLASATVTTAGQDAAGTHLEVSVPARRAYAGFSDLILSLGSALPTGAALPAPASIPDKNLKLDAWVRGGKLTQIELDLRQLAGVGNNPLPKGVDLLALHMTIRDFTGTIGAPAGAVPVDLQGLAQSFMDGLGAGSSGTMAPAPALTNLKCSDLKRIRPKDVRSLLSQAPGRLKALARQCPALHLEA